MKPATQNRTYATKNRERSTINRPRGIDADSHDRPKEQWARVVRIDETPTASRGRRENCAESIKNSIRNCVCSRPHIHTHAHTHQCIILRNFHPSPIVPADFPPSAAPRESRIITVIPPRLLCHLQTPKQRRDGHHSPYWILPVSTPDHPRSLIICLSIFLDHPSRLRSLSRYYNYDKRLSVLTINLILYAEIYYSGHRSREIFFLYINEQKYFVIYLKEIIS